MSSIPLEQKQIVRHNVFISEALLKYPAVVTPLVVWVIVFDNPCGILVRFWKMPLAFTIDHAWSHWILLSTGAVHHELETKVMRHLVFILIWNFGFDQ